MWHFTKHYSQGSLDMNPDLSKSYDQNCISWGRMDTRVCGWVLSLFTWNCHSVVHQLYPRYKIKGFNELHLRECKSSFKNYLMSSCYVPGAGYWEYNHGHVTAPSSFTFVFGGEDSRVFRQNHYHRSVLCPLAKQITLPSSGPDI